MPDIFAAQSETRLPPNFESLHQSRAAERTVHKRLQHPPGSDKYRLQCVRISTAHELRETTNYETRRVIAVDSQ
jgi:hypothetical protein